MASSSGSKKGELRVFDNMDDLTYDLVEYIYKVSVTSVKERGFFSIALSGRSFINLMRKLCEAPYNSITEWRKWYVFWADERAVARTHDDSNYKQAMDIFLSRVPVPLRQIFAINDDLRVDEAASRYQFYLRQQVKAGVVGVSPSNDCPKFDLVLLEMGSDGHVAALFPHHPALSDDSNWITHICDSPKAPPERITFTLPVINSASNVAILVLGEDKADALHVAVAANGDDEVEDSCASSSPARMVRLIAGKLVWFLDSAAASKLDTREDGSPQ